MPTRVLYESAGLFFKTYNHFAAKGRAKRNEQPTEEDSELDFLSRPIAWAEDVVAGISENLEGREQLKVVGNFLTEAEFYGLGIGVLSQAYKRRLAKNYVRADTLLAQSQETTQQKCLEEILQDERDDSMLVRFRVPGERNAYYVPRKKISAFVRTVLGQEIDVHQVRMLEAWRILTDNAKAPPEATYEWKEGVTEEAEKFQPPHNQLGFSSYALELLRAKLEKEEEMRAAYAALSGVLSQVHQKMAAQEEREKLIITALGRKIRSLVQRIPPSRRRDETLRMISAAAAEYIAMSKQNRQNHNGLELAAEVEALMGVWGEVAGSIANIYTRKVGRVMRELQSTVHGYSRYSN